MKRHLTAHWGFYFVFICFVLFAAVVVYFIPKQESVLTLNKVDSAFLDVFFTWITKMGEWLGGLVIAAILLIFKPVKHILIFILAIGIASSISGILKETVFENYDRPAMTFENHIKEIEGVDLHKQHSFPSGHTTAAFCMCACLAFSMGKMRWQLLAVSFACLTGISRVYLGQHYPEDVMAGAVLGTLIATVIYVYGIRLNKPQWLNKRLID